MSKSKYDRILAIDSEHLKKKRKKKKKEPVTWKIEQTDSNAWRLSVPITLNSKWEFWMLLTSDIHIDSDKCDRELWFKHHELAKKRGAAIICAGDLFDAMGGKYDPRGTKGSLRPEYKSDTYLDDITVDAARLMQPYADNFALIGEGNHETNIRKRFEIDLIQRTVALLNRDNKSNIKAAGYAGWLAIAFTRGAFKREGKRHRTHQTITAWFDHGYGGGGAVTKDLIQMQRRSSYIRADIIMSGHTHDKVELPTIELGLSANGRSFEKRVSNIKLGSYKKRDKWNEEKGHIPKPRGAYWLRFYYCCYSDKVLFDVIEAK